jgi:RNA polymerase sigma factor (sigma-70 family)
VTSHELASGESDNEPAQALSAGAFDAFFRDEMSKLLNVARLMFGHRHEDLAQEAMVIALTKWPKVASRSRGERFAYVKTTMVRLGLRELRRERSLRQRLPQLWNPGEEQFVESWVRDLGETAEVLDLVDRLPGRQRVVLALLLDGHSVQEVADIMEVSPSTVRSHLQGARVTLRPALRGRGAEVV